MANFQFGGFDANMFLPFYGSDTIEAVIQKLDDGQIDNGSIDPALTQIVFHTTGGLPSATFTLSGHFNPAAPLSSILTGFSIAAQGSAFDTDGESVQISAINQTLVAFLSSDLSTGPLGGNDFINGSISYHEMLRGMGGNDTLNGGGNGGDILFGDAGNDTLVGSGGPFPGVEIDQLFGGAGNDKYSIFWDGDILTELPNQGIDTVETFVSYTLGANFENLTLVFTGNNNGIIDGTGNELNNVITGTSGANVLKGMGGNDILNAGAGNDTLDGGLGADTMTGGAGNDTYVVDSALDKVIETLAGVAGGTDLVQSSASFTLGANVENLTLTGSADINATGNTLANLLIGNDGNNVLNGGAGADTMTGGLGDDTYILDNVGDTITELSGLGSGTDTAKIAYNVSVATLITLGTGIFTNVENLTVTGTGLFNLTGDTGDNILIGNASANTLTGGDGNDTLDGGLGNDTLNGGDGNDTYVLSAAGDTITDSSGIDTVRAGFTYSIALRPELENITLLGTAAINATGNDLGNTLTGNAAANILTGGGGNDILDGGAGNDTLNGGTGDDTMTGGAGNDTYVVDSTSDTATETLAGAAGGVDLVQASVTFTLGDNIENLALTGTGDIDGTGNALNNAITGNAGNNILNGMGGNDTMTGGAGNDTYVVDSTLDKVIETLAGVAGGTDLVQSSANFTLGANVENLTLTGSADINATGNTLANLLIGNDGNNVLNGGAGADTMTGGLGDDTYILDNVGDTITENPGEGNDTVRLVIGRNVDLHTDFPNIENVTLVGAGAFNLIGNDENNILIGNASANTLTGGLGNDTLDGGLGNDALIGGIGDDTYFVNSLLDAVTENFGEGTDTIKTTVTLTALAANVENLTLLGTAAINGTANALDNILTGNAAANTLDGGAGVDTMIGGAGNDTYLVDDSAETVTEAFNGGVDLVKSTASYALGDNVENLTLLGTGNFTGTGNTLNNAIIGNAGNNVLDGGLGTDTMTGGAGNDTYVVDSTLDKVIETLAGVAGGTDLVQSSANFTLGANVENLTLTGSADINATGNTLANLLIGNDGNNVLNGGAGADTMTGGLGNDTYVIDNLLDSVTEAAAAGNDTILIGRTVDLAAFPNIENVTLTGTGAFNATGDAQNNILTGNAANNVLDGGGGDDTYVITAGDTIIDSSGIDTVRAGFTYSIALRPELENLTLLGTAAINGTGNALDNILTGNAAANTLDGGAGVDTMIGGAGNDTYLVDDSAETVTEAFNGGVDLVKSTASYALGDNVENLTLLGTGNFTGTGNTLNNAIIGNAGNNVLDGGLGTDTMTGGAGNDTYVVDSTLDKVIETLAGVAGGTDLVQSSANFTLGANVENLTLTGSADINATGNTLANLLIGNDGNNVLNGGAGADTMTGGLGDDTYILDNVGDTITENPGEGNDTVRLVIGRNVDLHTDFPNIENVTLVGAGAFNLIGNDENNILIGNASANTLTGGLGNDTLDGGLGNDTLNGGDGNDTYVLSAAGDTITDSSGIDTVITSIDNYTLGSDLENLTMTGAAVFGTGNASANTITGNATANLLLGLDGNDILIGNAGDDLLEGGNGDDSLSGGIGNDTLMGGAGNDSLSGDLGDDTLSGGAGNDTLDGGAGTNTMIGGAGDDTYIVNSPTDVILEFVDEGTDTILSAVSLTDVAAFVEIVQLTGHADLNITGNSLDNHLIGNDGSNILDGGAGNDTLDGGGGADTLIGGAGDDTFIFDNPADVLVELPGGGNDTLLIGHDVDISIGFANLENVTLTGSGDFSATGNDLDNHLIGNSGHNALVGGNGNDVLDGGQGADDMTGGLGNDTYVIDNPGDVFHENPGEGSDTVQTSLGSVDLNDSIYADIENATLLGTGTFNLTGTAGDNVLTGNVANNILTGGDGNDTLDGGADADQMTGGSGDDLYFVDNTLDQVIETVSDGTDTIKTTLSDYNLPTNVENGQILAGALTIHGNELNNTLIGNTLDNYLDGAAGADTMIGGLGNDGYTVDDAGDSVVELANEGIDHVGASISYTLGANVENLSLADVDGINGTGNGLANVIQGGAGSNTLDGAGGDDQLFGSGGDDTLLGGAGNDYLDGGAGHDSLFGGDGDDTFVFDSLDQDTEVSGGAGKDTLRVPGNLNLTTIADDVFTGFEVIDLKASGFPGHSLTLAKSDVIAMSDTDSLFVKAQGGDTVTVSGPGWHAAANVTVDGTLYHTWTTGDATLHVENGAQTLFV